MLFVLHCVQKLRVLSAEQLAAPEMLPLFAVGASLEKQEVEASRLLATASAATAKAREELAKQQQKQMKTRQLIQKSHNDQLCLQRNANRVRSQLAEIQQVGLMFVFLYFF